MEERLKKDMAEMTFDLDRFFQPGYVIELCENTYLGYRVAMLLHFS